MSSIPSASAASMLQAAQAQQVASKARDRKRAEETKTQRHDDLVELRVEGIESTEAIRDLPANDSEQGKAEHESKDNLPKDESRDQKPQIDITG